jgi:hypothetical protein
LNWLENGGEEPLPAQRYMVNDTTYEALGEILAHPNGVPAFRDELVSLLKYLDNENNASARGFFLSAWRGLISSRVHVAPKRLDHSMRSRSAVR